MNEYTWVDIQTYVNTLPIERVITVYEHKKANNKERFLEALCDHNEAEARTEIERMEAEFLEKEKKATSK